jgi:hypothetical protein
MTTFSRYWPARLVRVAETAFDGLSWIGIPAERAQELAPRVEAGEVLGAGVVPVEVSDPSVPPWFVDDRRGQDWALMARTTSGQLGVWFARGEDATPEEAVAVAVALEAQQGTGQTWGVLGVNAPSLDGWVDTVQVR